MANSVQVFKFETQAVRTVTGPDGEPWFVAGDVCAILGLDNVGQALMRLDADEKSSIPANVINPEAALMGGRVPAIVSETIGVYPLEILDRVFAEAGLIAGEDTIH